MRTYKYQDTTCMKSTIPAHPTDFSMVNMHCLLFRPRLSMAMTLNDEDIMMMNEWVL